MDKIIIGFSRPKKFKILSWIIRKVEKTDYSHVYVKWYSVSNERWIIYQASGIAVNFVGQCIFEAKNQIIKETPIYITDDTRKRVVQFAIDKAGIPYGIKQLIGIGGTRLARFLGYKIANPFRDGKSSEVCAELVAGILIECLGEDIKEDLDTIGPKGIDDYVSRIHAEKKAGN